jgi:hypothetical protein
MSLAVAGQLLQGAPTVRWAPDFPDGKLLAMTETSDDGVSAEHRAIMDRLRADLYWLAGHGVQLSQWGPDSVSDKVRIYLVCFTESGRDLLTGRYGSALVVDTESRQWRFTDPSGPRLTSAVPKDR